MFLFLLIFSFLMSQQPFQMVLMLIFIILFSIPYLHSMNFFHWGGYLIIMVYLGGLLILFLYFTSIMTSYSVFYFKLAFGFLVVLFFLNKNMSGFLVPQGIKLNPYSGLFIFTFSENKLIISLIFFLLIFVLLLISFLTKLSTPMRQN